jgi:Protein of unknown function (DUF2442)
MKRSSSKRGGTTSADPTAVSCTIRRDKTIVLRLSDGRTLLVRPTISDRLARANLRQLSNFQNIGSGIHWPDVDEDLSIRGFLQQISHGVPGVRLLPSRRSRSAAYAP